MSAGKEREHCFTAAERIVLGDDVWERRDILMRERADARQPLIADLVELRTKHKALQEQLRQAHALCAVPDGTTQWYQKPDVTRFQRTTTEPFVLVASIRKILGGEHGE